MERVRERERRKKRNTKRERDTTKAAVEEHQRTPSAASHKYNGLRSIQSLMQQQQQKATTQCHYKSTGEWDQVFEVVRQLTCERAVNC